MDILKFSNAGGFTTKTRYPDMLAGNTVWNPYSPTGSYDSLASATGTGSSGTITFSNIPQTYTHLQLRVMMRGTSGAGGWATDSFFQINGDSTATNYYIHSLGGNGSAASASANNNNTSLWFPNPSGTNLANTYSVGIIDILDYTNINKYKTLKNLNGADLNGSGNVWLSSMLWKNTAAITSLSFIADPTYTTNWTTGSSFALYGVK